MEYFFQINYAINMWTITSHAIVLQILENRNSCFKMFFQSDRKKNIADHSLYGTATRTFYALWFKQRQTNQDKHYF